MLNLDTHIIIDLLRGKLKKKELDLVSKHQWSISDIVLWEISKLNQLGRIKLDLDEREIKDFFRRLVIHPISLDIASSTSCLDFSSDPADEIIAATSVVLKIPLLTRDRKILKSRMVPFATKLK